MWVIYIPRDRQEADLAGPDGKSLWQEAISWLERKTPTTLKAEDILCYPANLPADVSSLAAETSVYLLAGNSAEGWESAGWPDQSNPLSYDRMADRLIEAGLDPCFAGALKVYCSHGAEDAEGRPAFARRFADEMVRRGYNQCTIYGYLGEVTLHYVNSDSEDPLVRAKFQRAPELMHQGWHRYSTHGNHPFFTRRASDAKVQFFGTGSRYK